MLSYVGGLVIFDITIVISLVYQNCRKPPFEYNSKDERTIYILHWTRSGLSIDPPVFMGEPNPPVISEGSAVFINNSCSVQNCYITKNQSLFHDITMFDAIVFHAPQIKYYDKFPTKRSPEQIYIFASIESDNYHPLCDYDLTDFFNWTWTYRLDSDIVLNYVTVRDKNDNIIGPKEEMHWIDANAMKTSNLDEKVKVKLEKKHKAAAWFVSNCESISGRETIGKKLESELKKYGLSLDVYGDCGKLKCPKQKFGECMKMIERDYYFYLAFENSYSKDYVTEKILNGLENYAVPVVHGNANYTMFMPDGIYLDFQKLDEVELARQMTELMQDRKKYDQYFKWHNFYSYHRPEDRPDTNAFCNLCLKLNDQKMVKRKKVYNNFEDWWDPFRKCEKWSNKETYRTRKPSCSVVINGK